MIGPQYFFGALAGNKSRRMGSFTRSLWLSLAVPAKAQTAQPSGGMGPSRLVAAIASSSVRFSN